MRKITAFLAEIGADNISIASGGKHPRVVFRYNGEARQHIIAGTPGRPDESARRAIEDIRRSLGLVDRERRVSPPRRRRPRPRTPAPALPVLTARPQPDWRYGLLAHLSADRLRDRLDAAWQAWWREILQRQG
jgi:hypothetical protein